MTYKEFYNAIIENNITDETINFAKEKLVALEEKNAERRAKSKSGAEEVVNKVLEVLNNGKTLTAAQIAVEIDDGISTNKIVGACRRLEADGLITVEKVKGRSGKVNGYTRKEIE